MDFDFKEGYNNFVEKLKSITIYELIALYFTIDSLLTIWQLEDRSGQALAVISIICFVTFIACCFINPNDFNKRLYSIPFKLVVTLPIFIAVLIKNDVMSEEKIILLLCAFAHAWIVLISIMMHFFLYSLITSRALRVVIDGLMILVVPVVLGIALNDFLIWEMPNTITAITYIMIIYVGYERLRLIRLNEA